MANADPLKAKLMQIEVRTDELIKRAWGANLVTRLMHEPLGHHLNETWTWMAVLNSKPPAGIEYTGWGATTADAVLHALITAEDGEARRKQAIGSFKTGIVDAGSMNPFINAQVWELERMGSGRRKSDVPDWMGGVVPGGVGSFHEPAAPAATAADPPAVDAPPAPNAPVFRLMAVTTSGETLDLEHMPRPFDLVYASVPLVGGAPVWTLHRRDRRDRVKLFAAGVPVTP